MKFKYPNPFTPRFGSVPPHLAGRDHLLSGYSVAFVGGGNDPLLSAVFSGARGSGTRCSPRSSRVPEARARLLSL